MNTQIQSSRPLVAMAGFAALVPALFAAVFWLVFGRAVTLAEQLDAVVFQVVLYAAPFLLAALVAKFVGASWQLSKRAAVVGASIMGVMWIWLGVDGYIAQTTIDGPGANIGLGMLMLFAPILMFGVMVAMVVIGRRPAA